MINVVCGETCPTGVARASVLKSRFVSSRRDESGPNFEFLVFTFPVTHPLFLINSFLHVDLFILYNRFKNEF